MTTGTATATETRETQARTLLTIAKLRDQHPAEIDSELAEEIASGAVQVPGYDAAITVGHQQKETSHAFPWAIALAAAGVGVIAGMLGMWLAMA